MSMSRREFVCSAAGAAITGTTGLAALAQPGAGAGRRPVAVSSENGMAAVARAFELLQAGCDPVEAAVAGVNIVENDPNDHSVGYGGLPNEDGVVELDACVMHGPRHKAGAVAALQRIKNPSSVARLVMERTDHVLLVGEGALRFARAHGFPEEELLTDKAREIWLRWRETRSDQDDWLAPEADVHAARMAGVPPRKDRHGTITCLALTAAGDLGGSTTTSGLAFKIPGRVGDSPILGAGLYVDNEVGACGSTGRGEANLINCSSFLVVELMRGGAAPEDACRQVLQRVAARTEPRLRDERGQPNYGLKLYALRKDGVFGGASLRGTGRMAVQDGGQARLVELPGLYDALPDD